MQKKKKPVKLFVMVFVLLIGLAVVQDLLRTKMTALEVPDNAGVSGLETVDDVLRCTFQDGRTVVWNWPLLKQQGDFEAISDEAIMLDAQRLAAVNKEGKKRLTLYTLPEGKKQTDITVGWEDQQVWLRVSPDKQAVAVIRRNSPDSTNSIRFEFFTIDIDKELLSPPVILSITQNEDDFIDYALDNNGNIFAVGSQSEVGRIAAVDLTKGAILWDVAFEQTKEFCSVVTSPDGRFLYAGNREGYLYRLDGLSGDIIKKIQLLKDGETRPITNDYSVLNLSFSPDGQYYVATINPRAYVLRSDSDKIIHIFSPADRLVSKIAFSPDSQFIATSDIRAGWPIKIWSMPEEK